MESEKYQMDEPQKSSVASDMQGSVNCLDTEYLQALREEFFLLAGKNYLKTTPPQSKEEHDKFVEFLEKLGVLITKARKGSLVITVKCTSLQILEELWREYLSGHLGEVVQNCFVTEKILKELNLAELKLKTTMDIEEYNACKVYFERVALRDALSAQSYFIGTEDEVQLERRQQNTEVVESEKVKSSLPILETSTTGHEKEGEEPQETMKGTWPVPEFSAPDPDEELAKLRLKLQGMEVTSPSAVYSTAGHKKEKISRQKTRKLRGKKVTSPSAVYSTAGHKKEKISRQKTRKLQEKKGTSLSTKLSTVGHGKELEEKLKTMKLQEEKSILPLSEEEPEGLLMKLQRMKGSLPSSRLSTTDLEDKLEEVCVKLMRLRKEGNLAVPEPSTSYLVKKLAELCMELIRLRMEGTLPPLELFTANLEEELEELRVKLDRQMWEGLRPIRTFRKDVVEVLGQLREKRTEGSHPIESFQQEIEELLRQLREKRMEALENIMYPTIRSGLGKFDVGLPEELQSYVSYLFNESAKLGLRKQALHSLNAVKELREAMDQYELKTFLSIHIREDAWQVALLFMDELSSNKLPWDWFADRCNWWKDEETIGLSLYCSTSGILKAWPTEYDPDVVTLCKAITDSNWKVARLILSRSRISDEGLKNLSTALTQGELYSLTLHDSGLESWRLNYLCEALISRDCNLTSLNVSGNDGLGDEGIMHLCNVLTSVNCKLTSLNVSGNRLGKEGIMHLCNVLTSVSCKLTSLNVSGNWLGDKGIMHLCNVLTSVNCKLTSLNVRRNYCGSKGSKHLFDALINTNCTLTSLNISGNDLGDERIMHLFTILTSSNCTLTRLNVSSNRVGDRALKDLARALTNKNCVLTSLDIRYNQITDEVIKYLCTALTDTNCKLRSLDLKGNKHVTDVGKQCLSEAITGTDWEVRGGLTLSRSIKSEA